MPYALSFTEDFFCDGNPETVLPSSRPTSVYQAVLSMSTAHRKQIARDVLHVEPGRLDPLCLLEQIRQTNTCSTLESPVEVWIDREGLHTLFVYDGVSPP
jgi:hypothetical protein